MTDSGHIFISYARKDGGEHAGRLHTALESAGFRAWRDTRDIDPAQDFSAEIESGIEKAACVALCLTPESKRADSFVRREIQYAQVLKKPVIPLRFAEIAPHVSVITNEWIDFYKGWDAAFDRLCTVLKRPTSDAVAVPPASSADDPFREYLNALYQNIVRYLNLTVFSLVTLRGESAPDAVERAQVLPMAFFAMAGVESPDAERKQFQNFHEAFTEYNGRVLLLGDPGAGKTTTLFAFARDRVAARLEDPTLPLPILVPISTWDAQKQTPLLEWLAAAVPALKRDDIAHLLDSKRALLLLDGLDELGNEREDPQTHEFYDPRLRFIETVVGAGVKPAQESPIIISSRIKDYADIGHKVSLSGAVTLQPLDDNQMRAYLADLPDLWAALEADDDLREVARTPLLLSLFTFAFRDLPAEAQKLRDLKQGDLRDKIFETYVHRRYEREVRKPHSNIPFPLSEIYRLLGKLALRQTRSWLRLFGDESDLSIKQLGIVLGLDAQETESFVDMSIRLNLLAIKGENTVQFIHSLLRDYFVFVYSMMLLDSETDNTLDQVNAVYALGLLRDQRALKTLLPKLDVGSDNLRSRVVEALGRLGDRDAVDGLIAALKDENRVIRQQVATALGSIKHPYTVDRLLTVLQIGDWKSRHLASDSLMQLLEVGLQQMSRVLETSDSMTLRLRIIRLMGRSRNPIAIPVLMPVLHGSDPRLSNSAAFALEHIGTPEAFEIVRAWRRQKRESHKDSDG